MSMSESNVLLRSMERFFEKTKISLREAFSDGRYEMKYASIHSVLKDEVDDLVFGKNFSKLTGGQKTTVEGKIKKGEDHTVSSYKASEGAIYDAVVEYKDHSSILIEEILAEIKSKMEIIIHKDELDIAKDKTESTIKGGTYSLGVGIGTVIVTAPVKISGKVKKTGVEGHIKADGKSVIK